MRHDRKSMKRRQGANSRKTNKPASGTGYLKPRKPPYEPSTPARIVAGEQVELRGPQEDTAAADEQSKLAVRKAAWDKLLVEEETSRDEEDEYEDDGDPRGDQVTKDQSCGEGVATPGPQIETAADRLDDYIACLKERRSGTMARGLVGASTGLPKLDAATGGFQQITFVAANATADLTSFAAQASIAALRHDPKLAVVYYLLGGTTADELSDLMLCCESRMGYKKLLEEQLSESDRGKVNGALGRLREDALPRLSIRDTFRNEHGRGLCGEDIFNTCLRFMKQVRAERVLVVLDMLNDLPHPEASGSWDDDWLPAVRRIEADPDRWRMDQVTELRTRSEHVCPGGWPVLALCQLRKWESKGREPDLDDILGGVRLGHKAKQVFILVPELATASSKSATVPVKLHIAKARQSDMGCLPLLLHRAQCRFEEAKVPSNKGSQAGGKSSRPASKCDVMSSSPVDPLAGLDD